MSDRDASEDPTVLVRPARATDAAGVAEVHVRTWQSAYAGLLPADFLASLDVERRTEQWRAGLPSAAPRATWVAERDGAVVGIAGVSHARGADEAELEMLYVLPERQRGGIGAALLAAVVRHATDGGAGSLTLWVLDGNEQATGFYRRHGWTATGERQRDSRAWSGGTVTFADVRMTRPL